MTTTEKAKKNQQSYFQGFRGVSKRLKSGAYFKIGERFEYL